MKHYVIYDADGGIVARASGSQAPSLIGQQSLQIQDPSADLSLYYVANGALTPYTPEQNAARSSKPRPRARWSNAAMAWLDDRTLDEVRAARWEAIKAARDAFIDSHLPTPYGPFDCKPKDRQNITDAVALLQTLASIGQTGQTVTFTTAENQTVTLTLAQMTEVALLLGQRVQTAYAIGRAKRQALQEATTVAAVDAVTWE